MEWKNHYRYFESVIGKINGNVCVRICYSVILNLITSNQNRLNYFRLKSDLIFFSHRFAVFVLNCHFRGEHIGSTHSTQNTHTNGHTHSHSTYGRCKLGLSLLQRGQLRLNLTLRLEIPEYLVNKQQSHHQFAN